MGQTKRELETLPPVAQREVRKVSQVMDREGRDAGGKLSQGINQGLIRNSPLIVAGVSAALAAGAPVMLAAAGTLFAGLGAAAAAQTVEVREAFTDLGHALRDGAVQDASVLVPVYTRMAERIGEAFQGIRPQLRQAFQDTAPLVDTFTDGIIALAQNAMPGLVRAVASAGPVFDGLEHFLAATGTGLTDFFDAMSGHAPAAGAAFAAIGDIVGDLLPIIGELLGQGAELAAEVLPAVASATGLVLDVMQALGPMLPAVVAGFAAFKVAQTIAPHVQTLALNAQMAAVAMTGNAGAGQKLGGALYGLGKALPGVAVAFGLASAQMAAHEQKVNDWAHAILDGGRAAQTAAAQARDAASGFNEFVDSMQFGEQESPFEAMFGADDEDKFAEAKRAAEALRDAMTPLQQAEQDVTFQTNHLSEMIARFGPSSREAEGAADSLTAAQARLASKNGELERAIEGVTSAMVAQAQQALAAASSDYAYRTSLEGIQDNLDGITEAQRRQEEASGALAEAQRIHGAGSAEAAEAQRNLAEATEGTSDAQFELEGSLLAAAEAAGRLASDALPSSASELQHNQAAAAGSLQELLRLRTEMGDNFPPALNQAIQRLQQSGVALTNTGLAGSDTAARIRDLGFAVTEVPGQKFVRIDAPTAPQIAQLERLGYTVQHLPDGSIYVSADTATANAAIDYAARPRVATVRVVTTGGVHVTGPAGSGTILKAAGGPVVGPGSGTSDSIPARLSNGEHVLTAREVRAAGGHGQIMAWRHALTAGPGYADGGPVPRTATSSSGAADSDRALFHADVVNVIDGTPRDIAQELVYQGRTRGW